MGIRYEDLVRLSQDREPWMIMTAHLLEEDSNTRIVSGSDLSLAEFDDSK